MKHIFPLIKKYFIVCGIISYLVGTLHEVIVFLIEGKISAFDWKITQYHINYIDFGFVKRAMIGTLLDPLLAAFSDGGSGEIAVIWAIDFACFLALLILLQRSLRHIPSEWSDWLRLICLVSPLGLMQYAYDVGRYDHFNYLILASIVWFTARRQPMYASVALTAGILVHEAIFFYAMPLIILAITAERESLLKMSLMMCGPVIALACVIFWGNADPATLASLPKAVSGGVQVWERGVLEPAQNFGIRNSLILAYFVVLVPVLMIRYALSTGVRPLILLLPFICCLPLFGLGIDYFRWVHLMFVSFLAMSILLALRAPSRQAIRMTRFDKALGLALSIPLGPVGVDWGLPLVIKTLSILVHGL